MTSSMASIRVKFPVIVTSFAGIVTGISLQQQFHIVSLDASVYYIDSVPIQFNWWLILAINAATLLISTLVIWGSSHLISIGKPSETIRYE